MGIDQAGSDARAPGIEQVPVEGDLRLERAILTDPDHAPFTSGQRTVADPPQRIIRHRHHGRELTGMAKREVGVDQVARSIPCSAANSTATS